MRTSIHARAYNPNDIFSCFWYDETDILAWHKSSSKKKLSMPGSNYYQYLRYDNGVEGIRIRGNFRCPGGITRVPPPVPDLSVVKCDGTWSYHTPPDDFCPRA
jgi:hypothetical protein